MLNAYFLLAISIVFELIAASMLTATEGFTKLKPSVVCVICYVICFFSFGYALLNLNLGIAYATWGAIGTAVTPVVGYLVYKQRITKIGLIALILIIGSVVVLNLYG